MSFADDAQFAIDQAYRGLDPEERSIASDTQWEVRPNPTPQDLARVGASEGDLMVGLYHQPGGGGSPTVTIFQQNVEALRLPAWVVVEHELTHVLGYDHALRDERVDHGCGISAGASIPGMRDDCPACQAFNESAIATALLEHLAAAARQQGRIPIGLGGTIPQAKLHLIRAETLTAQLPALMPDRLGEIANLRGAIQHAIMALTERSPGALVSPDQIPAAAQWARQAEDDAYQFAWALYASRAMTARPH